jgi:hypothetical protein
MTPTSTAAALGQTRLSSPLVAALEHAWAAIQRRHRDLPDVVIVLASGSVGAPRGALKLGHFAAMRWTHTTTTTDTTADTETDTVRATEGRSALPEVFVGGEGLGLGAVDVLGTLLHEAAHALAHVRGVRDTSRQGRYHNGRFRDLATKIGLHVQVVPPIGWSHTQVPEATRAEYAAELDALARALTIHRRAEGHLTAPAPGGAEADGRPPTGTGTASGPGSRNGAAARCGCGRRIRVTGSVLALGPIACGLCGTPFTTPDTSAGNSRGVADASGT